MLNEEAFDHCLSSMGCSNTALMAAMSSAGGCTGRMFVRVRCALSSSSMTFSDCQWLVPVRCSSRFARRCAVPLPRLPVGVGGGRLVVC